MFHVAHCALQGQVMYKVYVNTGPFREFISLFCHLTKKEGRLQQSQNLQLLYIKDDRDYSYLLNVQ